MAAAVAWIRKYFVVASTARGRGGKIMRGRIARVFSSKPTQIINQWELERVIRVPRPKVIKRVRKMKGLIGKERTLTFIFGVWAQ